MLSPSVTGAAKLGLVLLTGSVAAQIGPVETIIPSAGDIDIAANLESYYAYGRSPEVLPAPEVSGEGSWAEAYQRARELVDQMTNDEKNNITYGFAYLIP